MWFELECEACCGEVRNVWRVRRGGMGEREGLGGRGGKGGLLSFESSPSLWLCLIAQAWACGLSVQTSAHFAGLRSPL